MIPKQINISTTESFTQNINLFLTVKPTGTVGMDFKKIFTIIFLFIAFECGLSEPEPEPCCGIGGIAGAVGTLAKGGLYAGKAIAKGGLYAGTAIAGAVAKGIAHHGYNPTPRRPSKLIDWLTFLKFDVIHSRSEK